MRRILLVDDEINVLHALQRTLRQCFSAQEIRVDIHTDPHAALAQGREAAYDVVISDYGMPLMNGVAFLQALRAVQPDTVRLILSASTDFGAIMQAVNQAEIFRYVTKPWDAAELKSILQLAFARRDELDAQRLRSGTLTPQELERRRLEAEEPGITDVKWNDDGSFSFDTDND